jgi:tRNA threonylcarbamoyladenosine biosynthesis protein TsaB
VRLYLALDTATPYGSVAAGTSEGVIAEVSVGPRRHAAATLPAAAEVLRLAGAGFADLEGVVLADGPGSFTGLRIGFATAKGILHEHPAVSLRLAPSLLALAWGARPFTGGPVAALYDALRGDVFAAVYAFGEGSLETRLAPCLVPPLELVRTLPPPVVAVGDGAAAHASMMVEWTGRPPVGPPAGVPHAGALLELLDLPGATTLVKDPEAVEPTYGRLAEAQARWEHAHGRPLSHPPGGAS